MSFAVQLPLHEEVALLFEVKVAVSTYEALWMSVLVPRLHDRTAVGAKGGLVKKKKKKKRKKKKTHKAKTVIQRDTTPHLRLQCFMFRKHLPPAVKLGTAVKWMQWLGRAKTVIINLCVFLSEVDVWILFRFFFADNFFLEKW